MAQQGNLDAKTRRRMLRRWLQLAVLSMAALGVVAYSQRDRIAYWLGHHDVFLSDVRLENMETIVIRHSGLTIDDAGDIVYQVVIRGPKGSSALWSPGNMPSRQDPKEVWLTKRLTSAELSSREVAVKFPMKFTAMGSGLLDCYIEKRPRTAEDDQTPENGIRIRFITEADEPVRISNVVAFP